MRILYNYASKMFRQRMCMYFLFSDDEFSVTALLSEAARIKIHT